MPVDDDSRARIESALLDIRPFTWIADRYNVSYADVAVVHHRMRPQPVGWPEQVSVEQWDSAAAAIRALDDE